jgi:cytochrome c556
MFRKSSIPIAIAAVVALFATSNLSAQYELVKVIEDRQSLMFDMQTSYWPLLAIKRGTSSDLAAAAVAAQTMNHALGAFLEMLPPGTAKGEVPGSRARPEIWTESAEFNVAADALKAAATSLADIARSGDINAFKAQFAVVEKACIGCHDFKPSGGGRFRFPR